MKNPVICKNCNSENPLYRNTCTNCKSYLRDKVYNLDFWKILAGLIENPNKTFKQIIFSEQKNFIFFILIFVAVKFFINIRFTAMLTLGNFQSGTELFISYFIVLATITTLIFTYSLVFTLIGKELSLEMRLKDNFSLLIYSQILHSAALFILFPIELIIFGDYLFSVNPNPFTIKESFAYLLLGLEIIVFLWSLFLTFIAFYSQINDTSSAILNTIAFYGILLILFCLLSTFVFTF